MNNTHHHFRRSYSSYYCPPPGRSEYRYVCTCKNANALVARIKILMHTPHDPFFQEGDHKFTNLNQKATTRRSWRMDELPIDLLQLRAQQQNRAAIVPAGADLADEDDDPAGNKQRRAHHSQRGENPCCMPTTAPCSFPTLPTKLPIECCQQQRPSISSCIPVATAKDLRALYDQEFRHSAMEDQSGGDALPRFRHDEIVTGDFLGKGAFGTVCAIKKLRVEPCSSCSSYFSSAVPGLESSTVTDTTGSLDTNGDEESDNEDFLYDSEEVQSRNFLSEHCIRANGDARFAIKQLRPDIKKHEQRKLQGISDLARETHFLRRIRHPNIIKLRAISYESEYDSNYFVVLDRLHDTLPSFMEAWKHEQKSTHSLFFRFRQRRFRKCSGSTNNNCTSNHQNFMLRNNLVMICFELSSALAYLHRNDIVYRDLKPANVGFNRSGDLILFDFGLVKEILASEVADADGLYKLTQMCGTPRYMAPEVGNGSNYGLSCDVYSFALLCWQLAKLERPYDSCNIATLQTSVWSEPHSRPEICDEWPLYFQQMLAQCWAPVPMERPTMQEIESLLAKEVANFREGFNRSKHIFNHQSSLEVIESKYKHTLHSHVTTDQKLCLSFV